MLLQLFSIQPRKKEPGLDPGTAVYAGPEREQKPHIRLFSYSETDYLERAVTADELPALIDPNRMTWLDVDGVHDVRMVEQIGAAFGLHPLTVEDIVNTNQRPKLEEYPEYVYIVLKMLHYDHSGCRLEAEQVSMIVGNRFVLSFQEAMEGDVFESVRRHIRDGRGRLRRAGSDFLAYSLIDPIVDYYLHVLEGVGEHIEQLEDRVLSDPGPDALRTINRLRRMVIFLRRSIWPLRDVLVGMERSDLTFMSEHTRLYFRDVYDHTVRTVEIIESSREVIASIIDLYMSTLSVRMNEVMKILAVISTFFLPLTFIAGVYGMNFRTEASPYNMPELNWYLGYPFALALMAVVALFLYFFFRRKRWM